MKNNSQSDLMHHGPQVGMVHPMNYAPGQGYAPPPPSYMHEHPQYGAGHNMSMNMPRKWVIIFFYIYFI